jgi:hypothetical protein
MALANTSLLQYGINYGRKRFTEQASATVIVAATVVVVVAAAAVVVAVAVTAT